MIPTPMTVPEAIEIVKKSLAGVKVDAFEATKVLIALAESKSEVEDKVKFDLSKFDFMRDFGIAVTSNLFSCRFHPTDWLHEVGCPHKEWTIKELQDALIHTKATGKVYSHHLFGTQLDWFHLTP